MTNQKRAQPKAVPNTCVFKELMRLKVWTDTQTKNENLHWFDTGAQNVLNENVLSVSHSCDTSMGR